MSIDVILNSVIDHRMFQKLKPRGLSHIRICSWPGLGLMWFHSSIIIDKA